MRFFTSFRMTMLMVIGLSIVDCRLSIVDCRLSIVNSAQAAVGVQVGLDGAAATWDVPIGHRRMGVQLGLEGNSQYRWAFRWDKEVDCQLSVVDCRLEDVRSKWFTGHRVNMTGQWHPVYEFLVGIRSETQIRHIWGEVFTGVRFSPIRWQLGVGVGFRIR